MAARLLPMLTVNPAMSALAAAGEAPMLKHNRFLIRATASEESEFKKLAELHCLAIGYTQALPNKPKKDEVLVVASPNLLAPLPETQP